ncbi:MAG: UDP-N-acetylmuramoyl-tripeptide--D-alanyl-D-alanine ligase [Sporocytophaga sp.]|uniref:UDP-N-acetylmuramoyl-tripeptide--D-alanyl-D- alanine ligase n=1 Tax=Sporocytophaga sp. TaxID=2231183 RepID=UPI001B0A0139|nr:UDP-N-acetylmuramoyl-tripeptide--D-alanyl-D-alanine ligase [Sporocytophaga sp.]MBO9699847.1 UDP-N-acetylmuramoyl-tripeptide--D-alanyl-D-alanine ligase [Sporocytophaga sp.]
MEINQIYQKYKETSSVSTDTRKIEKDCMFFALKGPNFNGNSFAEEALRQGAKYAVIDEAQFRKDDRFILVEDVLIALQQLANFHRKQLGIPIIAITGSNGKTTTKELVNVVLAKKYKTYATRGNLNNHIGIPLTLLAMDETIELGIVEMGANHQKEIEGYCKIAEPDFGLITNIGKAHLEGFGGEEGVKKGKGELYDYLLKSGKNIFLNTNDEILKSISKFSAPVTYPNKGNFYECSLIDASPFISFKTEDGTIVNTQLLGAYNFPNIAGALCIGKYFKVPADAANEAIASYNPENNRSQVIKKEDLTLILDAYNANPSSMKAAIENFAAMSTSNKKVMVLGDMFELGEQSEGEHRNLGKLIGSLQFDSVFLCGKMMQYASEEFKSAKYFSEKAELEKFVEKNKLKDSTVLIKGSRGMGLETLVRLI